MSEPNDRLLVFNGVNAATGEYLLPPLSAEVICKIARGEKMDPKHLAELKWRYTKASKAGFFVPLPRRLSSAIAASSAWS
jgi:hypothetical protein